ncbi:LysE family translocator [Verticiella sediminum]|uniref:LysE family translocator n=1 Tax=Verticiella sediminum TaxID=1247510 RepID=A0A556AVS1_9BURK|nr:LysE family translocator [Verticiella sediminum]TSH97053.1 LysE family translocator [Verticiella sediminum]
MQTALLLPVVTFSLAMSITPGPNNIMLTASGLNFGFRRTLPHMVGISAGVVAMMLAVGLILGDLFARWPWMHDALKYGGGAYLLYLAWQIARAGGPDQGEARGAPFTFWQAAAFQWVNPKAWIMVVGTVAAFVPPEQYHAHLLMVATVMGMVNLPAIAVWAGAGALLRNLLRDPRAVRWFNVSMAALLVASLYPALAPAAPL